MGKLMRFSMFVLMLIAVTSSIAIPAQAQSLPENCNAYTVPTGSGPSIYLFCDPPTWNGDLVVYAHGYVSPTIAPPTIPEDQLQLGGVFVPDIVNSLGYEFAMTSYPMNGLAVPEGINDILNLINYYKTTLGKTPNHVYLVGVSEGGLITTLAIEKNPDKFSGGLALCGPIGDFQKQIDYFGDYRVVYDYFFKNVLLPSAVNIPNDLINGWDVTPPSGGDPYMTRVLNALALSPSNTSQLLKVTGAPIDINDPIVTTGATTSDVLWYNVFATNDAIQKLGGQPFDNSKKLYLGSANDAKLNIGVKRYKANSTATSAIKANFQTSGKLKKPLITMHTTKDPVIPYWHEPLYTAKTLAKGSLLKHINIPVDRYGHCNFTVDEIKNGFGLMVLMASGVKPPAP